jgi:hypothetical protein
MTLIISISLQQSSQENKLANEIEILSPSVEGLLRLKTFYAISIDLISVGVSRKLRNHRREHHFHVIYESGVRER